MIHRQKGRSAWPFRETEHRQSEPRFRAVSSCPSDAPVALRLPTERCPTLKLIRHPSAIAEPLTSLLPYHWGRSSLPRHTPRWIGAESGTAAGLFHIPRSRHDPKILGRDDAEVVGDRIAKVRPIARNLFAQETERRVGELRAGCIAFVVRNVSVHQAP